MFLTDLEVKELSNGYKEVLRPLIYFDLTSMTYAVPKGFKTNYASVPKLPLVYLLFNDLPAKSTTLHDYLYSDRTVTRLHADNIFLRAMKSEGTPFLKRWAAYLAVRTFGGIHLKLTGGRSEG